MRAIREALAGFRRAPLLGGLSITAIGLSLLIIGLFGIAAYNIRKALTGVEARVAIVGYLAEDAPTKALDQARKEIATYPEVEAVRYVSKTEALLNASRDLREFSDVFSDVEINPLPASLELTLASGYRDPDHVKAVAARLRGYDFIEDVRFGQDWVERVFVLRRIAAGAAVILGGAFALAAVMLIATAVRMAVLARREEIDIMLLVGATEGYVRRPFLAEGLITGLAGGVLALGLTRGAYLLIGQFFFRVDWLPDLWVALGIALAGVLGMLAAGYAVSRELRFVHVL
ncbi:MAG: cell division protein FtsX [Gemmatimonadota bacterium]